MPPVLDRQGLFWTKKAVKTRDFEVKFSFVAMSSSSDGVFALWLSPDDFAGKYDEQAIVTHSKVWSEGQAQIGLTFVGNRPTFKGLGVFFLPAENAKGRQRVVSVWNDGVAKVALEDIRSGKANSSKTTETSWLNSEMLVKVRVGKDGSVVGHMIKKADESPSATWLELFSQPAGTVVSEESYFGFSGWSGSKTYIQLDINAVETRNFDETKAGGEVLEVDEDQWKKVLAEEKKYLSQASQMQAVQKLTTLLSDHIERYTSIGEKVKADVAKMETRLEALGEDFGKLVSETEAFDFKTGAFNTDTVKEHIKGLSKIFSADKETHDSKFQQVHEVAKDLKAKGGSVMGEASKLKVSSAAQQAKTLEESATRGSNQSGVLLLCLVVVVAGLGILFLNRMRYYEKKHYI